MIDLPDLEIVQSVAFDRNIWKLDDASDWCHEHGYPPLESMYKKRRFVYESPSLYIFKIAHMQLFKNRKQRLYKTEMCDGIQFTLGAYDKMDDMINALQQYPRSSVKMFDMDDDTNICLITIDGTNCLQRHG